MNGVHLFIEKPFSNDLESIDKLSDVVKKNSVVVLVGYVLRFDQAASKYYELIRSQCLGKILHVQVKAHSYLPDWRPEQDDKKTASAKTEYGGGVLLELSHELDYVNWFFGDIQDVTAQLCNTKNLGLDVDESADLILISSGIPVTMHLDVN